ncbi:hypothetical protein [Streptomyces sp. NPDC059639]|uniref:hypothetical protein n=1 Tax=Streptomyces sp. NPDC059639 TaxID=3346891 RepID=UPI0036CBA39C
MPDHCGPTGQHLVQPVIDPDERQFLGAGLAVRLGAPASAKARNVFSHRKWSYSVSGWPLKKPSSSPEQTSTGQAIRSAMPSRKW